MQLNFNLTEIEKAAKSLLTNASTSVIRLDGAMGAGKTTLIAAAVNLLGVKDPASSPTFSLVNCYRNDENSLYHFDFYRLTHPDEALDFGLEEYLDSGKLCFLEWAEKITPHLPLHYDHFEIQVNRDGSRVLNKIK